MVPLQPDDRALVVHKVFTGVNTENYGLVADTLATYERDSTQEGFRQGHLRGFLLGIAIGAVIGVMISGLPQCANPTSQAQAQPTPHQATLSRTTPVGFPQPSAVQLLLLELVPPELRWYRHAPAQQAQGQEPGQPAWAQLEPQPPAR